MALRHPTDSISTIVPKTALIEDDALLAQARDHFGHNPVRVPQTKPVKMPKGRGRRAIVTTMKYEGPFILEWLAYHRAIGFDDILVYTNDCDDGTDDMLAMLMRKRGRRTQRQQVSGNGPQAATCRLANGGR